MCLVLATYIRTCISEAEPLETRGKSYCEERGDEEGEAAGERALYAYVREIGL